MSGGIGDRVRAPVARGSASGFRSTRTALGRARRRPGRAHRRRRHRSWQGRADRADSLLGLRGESDGRTRGGQSPRGKGTGHRLPGRRHAGVATGDVEPARPARARRHRPARRAVRGARPADRCPERSGVRHGCGGRATGHPGRPRRALGAHGCARCLDPQPRTKWTSWTSRSTSG